MLTYFIVPLPNKPTIKLRDGKEVQIEQIEIFQLIDSPAKKTVIAICRYQPMMITLWEGPAYDAIGQWKDSEVTRRIQELYSN